MFGVIRLNFLISMWWSVHEHLDPDTVLAVSRYLQVVHYFVRRVELVAFRWQLESHSMGAFDWRRWAKWVQ